MIQLLQLLMFAVVDLASPERQLCSIQLLLQLLPRANHMLLQLVLKLLHEVSEQPLNKMTVNSLAMVFVPHLLVPRTGSATEFAADIDDLTVVAAFMIANHHVIFHAPAELVGDIRLFWERIECGNCSRVAAADKTPSRVSHSASHKLA